MSLSSTPARIGAAAALVLCAAGAADASAAERIYSYDPANEAAHTLAEGGLTFVFRKSTFGGTRVLKILSTQDKGTAELKQADQKALGPGGIDGLVGHKAPEHDLYEIEHEGQGEPLIRAACPGSDRAWLAFGSLDSDRQLIIHAFGRNARSGKIHLCATLAFDWHGEWRLPVR